MWERPKWWCAAKKVSSYTVRREGVLWVSEKNLSYKGMGEAEKGGIRKKEISMQNMEDTEFVQIAQNRFSGKVA